MIAEWLFFALAIGSGLGLLYFMWWAFFWDDEE
jgi:hypothetical protein